MMETPNTSKRSNEAGKAVLALAYAMILLQVLSDFKLGTSLLSGTAGTVLLALVATLAVRRQSRLAGDVIAVCLVGQVAILTVTYRGHPWQIDTHMVYFVMLAGISTLGNIRALLVGAGATAVHHLGLTFFLPALVYPTIDLMQNIERTVLHAGVVVFETAILVQSIARSNALVRRITEQSESVADQSHRAEIAEAKARQMVAEAEQAIGLLRTNLHRLADRNLTCEIKDTMPEAFEDLRRDFNLAVLRLDAALGHAQGMAHDFDGEARLLGDLLEHLAQGTQAQASGLGRQAELVQQLSGRLEASARQAERAAQRVSTARDEADQGGEITNKAVAAMQRIERSSGEVSNIMDLIDDIAFQTNLLALNAGVEAARAGASGRGFAVVAGEVQALSQRTAEAARGVKELISSSEEQVASGAKLVNEAGRRLSKIVEHVNEVNAMIEDIRKDAGSRATEMADVSQQISELDSKAQAILDQSAEMAGSGQRLRSHADELAHVMARFTINDSGADAGDAARRRA
ncbi:methyl-accepting chemotaxis protein [Tropicibacter oceani]|uniref:Methyl-accepting chemotaxis protein n=1 Tax=Tropicibacter oceani TaxID=3058420 RepID=A0ABY8QFW1_9RHOB|nr:methyl-accepting chemotaxis protein [Tropicibacter oceani]WGW02901.1 methyl-accepting chemotaxis protein [Tropicibacter oceani]